MYKYRNHRIAKGNIMIEFKKIDLPFASDLIAEKFDNILELLHPNALAYGGAIRDITAGLSLKGDLDIVAAGADYDYCISKVSNSGKWRKVNTVSAIVRKIKGSDYSSNKAIKKVSTFETFGNKRVELIKAVTQLDKHNLTATLEVIKTVDITCCGVAMDIYGNAYEILEGARQDCLDRVLKLNSLNSDSNIENLKNRIIKLEKRGWTSRINLDKATKMLDKIKKARKKELAGKISERKRIPYAETISLYNEGSHIRVVLENVNTGMLSSNKMTDIAKKVFDSYKIKVGIKFKQHNFSSLTIEVGPIGIDTMNMEKAATMFKEELHLYIQNCQSGNKKSKINLDKTPSHGEPRGLQKSYHDGEVISNSNYRRYEKYGCKTTSDRPVKKPAAEVVAQEVPTPAHYSRIDELVEEVNNEEVLAELPHFQTLYPSTDEEICEELPLEEQSTAPRTFRKVRDVMTQTSKIFSKGGLVSEYKPSYAYSISAPTHVKRDSPKDPDSDKNPDSDDVERAR